jgi:hypothetical protein
MSGISITSKKVYAINGLAEEDIELLSLALHKIAGDLEQPDLDRASTLVQTVDAVLREE